MLKVVHSDPRAWRSDTIDACDRWRFRLPDECLRKLDAAVGQLCGQPRPLTTLTLDDFAGLADDQSLAAVKQALEHGRGFVIIDGLPVDSDSPEDMQAIYWLVGCMLGRPMEQNVEGTLLYDVRDTGKQLSEGARFSVTSYESSFHTDNSFGEQVLDYVGLLCLQTARSGGLSQLVSGHAVYEELRQRHPAALATLCKPFHVDRRGGVRPGESPTVPIPIFAFSPGAPGEGWGEGRPHGLQNSHPEAPVRGGLLVRYLRHWIEVGHEKTGQPLSAEQRQALDVLDEVLRQPELRVEFMLRPGDMFWINNRWLLHNRTAFEDYPEPERKRHYVRLWIQDNIHRPGAQ